MSEAARVELAHSVYPERLDSKENALDAWTRQWVGALWHQARPFRKRLAALAQAATALAGEVGALDDDALRQAMRRVARDALDDPTHAARAFALVREASHRSLGMRPFDVQLMGAAALFAGKLSEMQTGEGKTLTAGLAACIAGVAGLPVHVVTVNDYLAERDAAQIGPLFAFFGLTVGTIVTGMDLAARARAYACHITYCTNKELVFDYLKDRVAAGGRASRAQLRLRAHLGPRAETGLLLRGLHFAIVDEADSILIDEARTPLILAEKGDSAGDPEIYRQALRLAAALEPVRDFELLSARRQLHLTDGGRAALAELCRDLGPAWTAAHGREHLVSQALRALHLYQRDQQYLVAEDKVHIVDEYTGRILPGRTWEQGLHQMIETKEGCPLSEHNRTLARITYQRFFRRYLRLSGMTGTAQEVRREIWAVYRLETVTIPTNRPSRRQVAPTICCANEDAKWRRVAQEAQRVRDLGRPVLIGTRSVEDSENLSAALDAAGIAHRVLNARQDAVEAEIVAQAGAPGVVTVATNMAGRGTDIHLGPGVAESGGLHVILTDYHDSPRIDRQLFGRCARQGDPGSAVAIVAIDDILVREHGGAMHQALQRSYPLGPPAPLFEKLRRHAQRRAEAIHARTRRDTLKQDLNLDTMLAFAGNQI
ncbi:MAG: preprotein translocase subunit SecA [Rhodoferax sp.]|jgi:preprotein translocase subunit SecA|nr:preprotein translocase subunit SecA [Rhodoferax sp.]